MRFVVLGGLHIQDDAGLPVTPRALRQRQLLAVLLCSRGHGLASEYLVDLLWDGDPPPSAAKNLQTYVHRLRTRIGADRIEFGPNGYSLRVEDGELDLAVFEAQAARGSAALADGDAGEAYARLTGALAEWNGEPFADLTSGGAECPEPVRLEIARSVELQLGAREDHADAALALGHASGLIPELTSLLSHHPLRERLRGALMIALYRSGRAAEALEIYRAGRELLVEELGIEPGPALRDLEQAILTDDAALTGHDVANAAATGTSAAAMGGRGGLPTPAELPTGQSGFTGRGTELSHLTELLRTRRDAGTGNCVVAISGPGGVGKSALAIQVAIAVTDDFLDGQLYVDLHGATPGLQPLPAEQVVTRFLRSLGVADADVPTDADEAAARFRSLTAGRRILFVLDDAADAAQVRPLLPGGNDCAVLITSRPALTGLAGAVEQLRLDPLTRDEAITLVANLAGADRIAADPDGTSEITRRCDLLPLALRIAGARLAARSDWSPTDLADRLADSRTRLDELTHGDLAVTSSCQVSHDALPETAARLFELAGLLNLHHVTIPVAAALADRPDHEARRDLDHLVAARLFHARGDVHTLHGLIRLYARTEAHTRLPHEAHVEAIRRVGHHYLATARNMARQLPRRGDDRRARIGAIDPSIAGLTFESPADADTWLRTETDNLLAVAEHALALPDDGPMIAAGLSAAVSGAYSRRGHPARALALGELALRAVEPHGPPGVQATLRGDIAWALIEQGRYDEATTHAERALELAERALDDFEVGGLLNTLCVIRRRQKRLAEAVTYGERAVEVHRRTGDKHGEAGARSNYAIVLLDLGKPEEAAQMWSASLEYFQDSGDVARAAMVTMLLSKLHLERHDLGQAIAHLKQATELNRECGDRYREAITLWRLGNAVELDGNPDEGRASREQALRIFVEIETITQDESDAIRASATPTLPGHIIWV